jgi:putative ABC transport system permease protein
MRWIPPVVWWRSLFRRRRIEAEMDAELRFHFDQQVDENIAAGMTEAEARAAAARLFGGTALLKDQCRDSLGVTWLDDLVRDLRYAVRTLGKSAGFTAVAVLTLAIGIGANTTFFTLVRSILLEPLPFADPGRLVMLFESTARFPYNVVAGGVFERWQRDAAGFEQMAIYGVGSYNLAGTQEVLPERVDGAKCSWNLFATLGVQPALGRTFTASDDDPGANPAVVLSWSLWQRRFAGQPFSAGREILLDGQRWSVVGVMPAWFSYPDPDTQLWTPIRHETRPAVLQALGDHQFSVVARLRPGVRAAEAATQIDTIEKRLHAEHLDQTVATGAAVLPLLDAVVYGYQTPLYVLMAAAGCFLLIACLNIASLFVARFAARRRELAIRTALGGTRGRLIREQLTESLVLSAAGGAAGTALAWLALRLTAQTDWMAQLRAQIPRAELTVVDGRVLGFVVALTLVSGALVGLVAALRPAAGHRVVEGLQDASRGHTAGRERTRLRRTFLAAEIGLTVALLAVAGLLLQTYLRLRASDVGCATANVLTVRVTPPKPQYDAQRRAALFEAVADRVRRLPGVTAAAMATTLPAQGYEGDTHFAIVEHPPLPTGQFQFAIRRGADPAYFAALRIPILRGRAFLDSERLERATSAIVSDLFVRRFFPDEDPIGKHLRVDLSGRELDYEIVGVAADTRFSISKPAEPTMYFPLYSGYFGRATIAVRAAADPLELARPIQKIVAGFDPDLPVSNVLTLDRSIGLSTLNARFNAGLVLGFAGLSLLLACVGVYGVLSYLVTQRTAEMGIRMALGAQRADVLGLVVADGLRPIAVGVGLGLVGALSTSRLIAGALYGVGPLDLSVFATVTLVVSALAIVACLVPAWRATRLDPLNALREG